jgi:hypothetical protein
MSHQRAPHNWTLPVPTVISLNKVHRTSTSYSNLKYAFLSNLKRDLRRIGIPVNTKNDSRNLRFELGPGAVTQERINTLVANERCERLISERKFLRSLIRNEIQAHFADGALLEIGLIRPAIHFCTSGLDRSLFRLCVLMQSVPPQRLLYRQITALVRDEGHAGHPVIGAFGLASSGQVLGCRDKCLGWHSSPKRKRKELQRSMQLAVCISVPPYCHLRGGKLVAALAASREVADEFKRKYHPDRLETISTTSAKGVHSPIFNRVMVRPGGLYKRIGETSGYSTLLFSKRTISAAASLVKHHDGSCPETRTIQLLKRALNLCNLPREQIMRLGVRKGVYLAVRAIDRQNAWPTQNEIVNYWKTVLLPKCLGQPELLLKFANSHSVDLLKTLTAQ